MDDRMKIILSMKKLFSVFMILALEEPYVPHALVGVMAQNTRSAAKEKHVWSNGTSVVTGNKKI